jgi:hypothetical protein
LAIFLSILILLRKIKFTLGNITLASTRPCPNVMAEKDRKCEKKPILLKISTLFHF